MDWGSIYRKVQRLGSLCSSSLIFELITIHAESASTVDWAPLHRKALARVRIVVSFVYAVKLHSSI